MDAIHIHNLTITEFAGLPDDLTTPPFPFLGTDAATQPVPDKKTSGNQNKGD